MGSNSALTLVPEQITVFWMPSQSAALINGRNTPAKKAEIISSLRGMTAGSDPSKSSQLYNLEPEPIHSGNITIQ